MLNKNQFLVLSQLLSARAGKTQREVADAIGLSVGTVNRILMELRMSALIHDFAPTDAGRRAMEPYRVRNAVLLAAGVGSRMLPITLNTPKPLIRVNGTRIIDTLLDALIAAEVENIYVVVGYLSEQFRLLLDKYPQVHLVRNPEYNVSNNISSVYYAREHLRSAYVVESDLLLLKPELITKYQYGSNYLAVPVERTNDWCFQLRHGTITKISVGGEHCSHMFGISYWTDEDGRKLQRHVDEVYHAPGGKERYWDEVALKYNIESYRMFTRECTFSDIVEIDTFAELKSLDAAYAV